MASIGSTVCIYVLLVLYLVPDFARTSFVTTFPLHRSLRRMPIAHDRKITKDVQVFPDSNRIAYFVNVTIGNPAQDVTLCLDTGSGNLAVFSSLCKGCNSSEVYSPRASRTAVWSSCKSSGECSCQEAAHCTCAPETGLCDVSVEYVDSSGWEAHVVTDLVSVGPYVQNFTLASIYNESGIGTFYNNDDGTIGFAYGEQLSISGNCWFEQWSINNKQPKIFGLCMGQRKGKLSLGGIDVAMLGGPVHYTPLLNTGFYSVNLTTMRVEHNQTMAIECPVSISPGDLIGPIFDSGNTLTRLDTPNYNSFVRMMISLCKQSGQRWRGICDSSAYRNNNFSLGCIEINSSQLMEWPIVSFEFLPSDGSAAPLVNMSPFEYMNPLDASDPTNGVWCLNIVPTTSNINLGDPVFRSSVVIHDLDEWQIGLAPPRHHYCS